jgi:hypothetical protein
MNLRPNFRLVAGKVVAVAYTEDNQKVHLSEHASSDVIGLQMAIGKAVNARLLADAGRGVAVITLVPRWKARILKWLGVDTEYTHVRPGQ